MLWRQAALQARARVSQSVCCSTSASSGFPLRLVVASASAPASSGRNSSSSGSSNITTRFDGASSSSRGGSRGGSSSFRRGGRGSSSSSGRGYSAEYGAGDHTPSHVSGSGSSSRGGGSNNNTRRGGSNSSSSSNSNSNSSRYRDEYYQAEDRPSGGGRGGASSSSRGRGGRGGGRGSSSSRTERSPMSQPPRARDILLKRPPSSAAAPAAENGSGNSSRSSNSRVSEQADRLNPVAPVLGSSSSSDGGVDPTFIPRDPKVQDGPWSAIDKQLVMAAQRDAQQQAQQAQQAHTSSTSTSPQDTAASSSSSSTSGSAAEIKTQGFVLLGKTAEQLAALAEQLGQPKYRGKQILDSVLRGCRNVLDLHGLPKGFREQLAAAGVVTGRSVVHHSVRSPDGTQKLLLQLAEGRVVETVGIPVTDEAGKQRLTVCVSSQVGCPMRCTFCATGKGGFARNLQAHEIVDQVMTIGETFQQRPTNVVFMGMGEPLLNIPAVVAAANYLREQLGMSGRSITISTVGVPHAMAALSQHQLTATLAVSIHAPNQELREQLIPSARVYPIQALMSDCRDYFKATGRRVTFEYTLMGGTNDGTQHAAELARLLRQYDLASHVNLIPWNPVDESPYSRPGKGKVAAFRETLEKAGIPVSVRTTRGLEAAAACGQLRNQFQKAQLQNPQPLL